LPLEKRARAEVASLTALPDAPLATVEGGIFHRRLNAPVELGREDGQFRFGSRGCTFSPYRTRKTIIEQSNRLSTTIISENAERLCVSLVTDAGTIERRHFLDLVILTPHSGLRPFSNDSFEKDRLIAQAIEELGRKGVKLRSVVEITYRANLSICPLEREVTPTGQSRFLNGINYSPSLCHFIQLVVSDCIANIATVHEFETLLQDLINITNSSDVCEILRGRCPQSAKT
jgi:hypothetical protein